MGGRISFSLRPTCRTAVENELLGSSLSEGGYVQAANSTSPLPAHMPSTTGLGAGGAVTVLDKESAPHPAGVSGRPRQHESGHEEAHLPIVRFRGRALREGGGNSWGS